MVTKRTPKSKIPEVALPDLSKLDEETPKKEDRSEHNSILPPNIKVGNLPDLSELEEDTPQKRPKAEASSSRKIAGALSDKTPVDWEEAHKKQRALEMKKQKKVQETVGLEQEAHAVLIAAQRKSGLTKSKFFEIAIMEYYKSLF